MPCFVSVNVFSLFYELKVWPYFTCAYYDCTLTCLGHITNLLSYFTACEIINVM